MFFSFHAFFKVVEYFVLKQEVKKGNYEAARTLGNAAGAKGMEALAALPATTAVDAKEIDDLKSRNKHELADSLANVKRLLDSTNFIEFMLAALQPLQSVTVVEIKTIFDIVYDIL